MCDRLSDLREAMESFALAFDPYAVSVAESEAVLRHATVIKNMATTVATVAAGRVAEAGMWKRTGERSAAHDLANKTGTAVGTAAQSLKRAKRLAELPKTQEAARRGELSEEQASLIADAAEADPDAEERLLDQAARGSLSELQDECARTKAAKCNREQRRRAIHDRRVLREYTDVDGAWNLHARDNPEVGARIMAAIAPIRDELFRKAREEGRREPTGAYAMDALAAMADRVAGGTTDGDAKPRYDAKILARIDLTAWLRGYPIDGETCEIVGYGPVAVSAINDLIDTGNPFLAAIATDGTEVLGVAHLGRRFTAAQVSALQWRDPTCVVEGCNQTARLQIDHREDWAKTHVSLLEWAERMCPHDHDKKTRLGWALVAGTGKRAFVPPDDPRHPKHAGRAPPASAAAA